MSVYMCVRMCVHVYACMCTHVCLFVHMSVCFYVCVYVLVFSVFVYVHGA